MLTRFIKKSSSLLCLLTGFTLSVIAQSYNIKNDVFWNTADGKPIYSQGGGIFRFADPETGKEKYYWYGVHYKGAEDYRNSPFITQKGSNFESVTCYSSTDLVNWKFEADVLTKDAVNNNGRTGWVGRLGVAYIKQLNKYAMFVQHNARVMINVSDSPLGPFTLHQEINMEPMIGTTNTGDQTVFTDDDGKSYLIYSYGKGRNKIYVSEIGVKDGKVDLLDCTKVFQGESREGNCMFKYKGKYYMCASNIYGWDASYAYYLVADNIRGPYTPANNMQVMKGCEADYAHVTQTGFFYTIKGSKQETVVYCGDRWADFAGNGLGYNQWCPLSFDANQMPYFNSLSSWDLDAVTGLWKVAPDNNYANNGSFEADRKNIPSPVKPVQEQLTGWTTNIINGNKIVIGSADSVVLNHVNSEDERKIVTGEKSLQMTDKVPFKRSVYQTILPSPYVKMPDGTYTLTAKIKNSAGFNSLEMYAMSWTKRFNYDIKDEHKEWTTIVIRDVVIKGGMAEIGFRADGAANAVCYVDDIELTKNK